MKKRKLSLILMIHTIAIIFLAVQIFTPMLVLGYYERNGYSFSDDVAYINESHYQTHVTNPNEEVLFEYETVIHLDYLSINNTQFDIVFSDVEIFDIGMMNDFFSLEPISLYAFDFLHGSYFTNPNDIVITEGISLTLFGHTNSVNDMIVIEGMTFQVAGVLKTNHPDMDYIYIPNEQLESIGSDIASSLTYRLFKDDRIYKTLYERGGTSLVHHTVSYKNQSMIRSNTELFINISRIVLGFTILGITNLLFKHRRNEISSIEKDNKKHLIKKIVTTYLALTVCIVYFLAVSIANFAMYATYEVGFLYFIDDIIRLSFVLYIYLVPVVLYLVKRIVGYFKNR